jgi:hypothetical protein
MEPEIHWGISMKPYPFALLGVFALFLTGAPTFAAPERGNPDLPPPNLAVDVDAPGALRAELQIYVPELEQPLSYQLKAQGGSITGGVFVPPGKERHIYVTAFDENKEPIYHGETIATVDEKLTPEIAIRLEGKESGYPLEAKLGSYRLELGMAANEVDSFLLRATLIDALGEHVKFDPEDIDWRGPKGIEILPYSCFGGSACIELPDPKIYADFVACFRDIYCSSRKPKDTRGPYDSVAVGWDHTCALTVGNEILCWGNNSKGQLGAPTGRCIPNVTDNCSLSPVPVVCPQGEACRFIAVTAGAEHTCALDIQGKVWCWGEDGNLATGKPTPDRGLGLPTHRAVPISHNGAPVTFKDIDTNIDATCALSDAWDVFCWGKDLGLPQVPAPNRGSPQIIPGGKKYKAVNVGFNHTCLNEWASGRLECFGSNFDFQITGTLTPSPAPLTPTIVNPLVPLLRNYGAGIASTGWSDTCAQNWDADIICWGSANHGNVMIGGFVALRRAYANSLATEGDMCGATRGNFACGTHTCLTSYSGDMFCGSWTFNVPPQLTLVPDPPNTYGMAWNQMDLGPNHGCGVSNNRDVFCWGYNTMGQFGTGMQSAVEVKDPVTAALRQ